MANMINYRITAHINGGSSDATFFEIPISECSITQTFRKGDETKDPPLDVDTVLTELSCIVPTFDHPYLSNFVDATEISDAIFKITVAFDLWNGVEYSTHTVTFESNPSPEIAYKQTADKQTILLKGAGEQDYQYHAITSDYKSWTFSDTDVESENIKQGGAGWTIPNMIYNTSIYSHVVMPGDIFVVNGTSIQSTKISYNFSADSVSVTVDGDEMT